MREKELARCYLDNTVTPLLRPLLTVGLYSRRRRFCGRSSGPCAAAADCAASAA